MSSWSDVSPNLRHKHLDFPFSYLLYEQVYNKLKTRSDKSNNYDIMLFVDVMQALMRVVLHNQDSLLGERLLLVDAHIEQHRLYPQQHAVLDLPWQCIKHASRERDANVEPVSISGDHRQHVGGRGRDGLCHLECHVPKIHYSYVHVL